MIHKNVNIKNKMKKEENKEKEKEDKEEKKEKKKEDKEDLMIEDPFLYNIMIMM